MCNRHNNKGEKVCEKSDHPSLLHLLGIRTEGGGVSVSINEHKCIGGNVIFFFSLAGGDHVDREKTLQMGLSLLCLAQAGKGVGVHSSSDMSYGEYVD